MSPSFHPPIVSISSPAVSSPMASPMAPSLSCSHLLTAYPQRHVDREPYTTGRLDALPAGKHTNVDRLTGGYVKPKHERTTPVFAYTSAVAQHRADATPGSRPAGIASCMPTPALSWQETELVKEFDQEHRERKGTSNAARNVQAVIRGKQSRASKDTVRGFGVAAQ